MLVPWDRSSTSPQPVETETGWDWSFNHKKLTKTTLNRLTLVQSGFSWFFNLGGPVPVSVLSIFSFSYFKMAVWTHLVTITPMKRLMTPFVLIVFLPMLMQNSTWHRWVISVQLQFPQFLPLFPFISPICLKTTQMQQVCPSCYVVLIVVYHFYLSPRCWPPCQCYSSVFWAAACSRTSCQRSCSEEGEDHQIGQYHPWGNHPCRFHQGLSSYPQHRQQV